MENRSRKNNICFRVSDEEKQMIQRRMKQTEIVSLRAYLLKMAIDGYVLNLDLTEITKMNQLLGNVSNNINQIARRVNSTGNIYEADIQEIKNNYDKLIEQSGKILGALTAILSKEVL